MSWTQSLRGPAWRLALLVALAALTAALAAGTAQAAFPGANGKITFDRYSSSAPPLSPLRGPLFGGKHMGVATRGASTTTDQVWAINPDGSGAANVSNNAFLDEYGNWSPDGTKIVFDRWVSGSSQDEIWVMNADGSGQTDLTNDASAADDTAAWSPDGKQVAYTHFNQTTSHYEVWAMNADGSGKHQLVVPDPAKNDAYPNWSPDGTKVAFARYGGGASQVFVANVDGSGTPQAITDIADFDTDPNWSPDGTKIAFGSVTGRVGTYHLAVANADGSGAHAVTSPAPNENDNAPAWSPDGTMIAYEQLVGTRTIWVVNADGSNNHQVSDPPSKFEDYSPDWQPVGVPASTASLPTACTSNASAVVVHAADATGFKSPLNVHYKVDGGAEQVVAADASGNVTLTLPNGTHSVEYWAGDAAGYQEAAHHTGTVTIDTLTKCTPAKVGVAGVRRACVSKRFSIRVHISTAATPKSVRVYLGKKRILTTTKTTFRLRINPAKLRRHTRLRIVATDASGRVTTISRTIARCAVAKPRRHVSPRFTG